MLLVENADVHRRCASREPMCMKISWPLVALAIGAFGIGTTEFAPMGLLPVIASGLSVSIPKAGLLVTGYALGVMVGAPLLTLPTGRIDRKLLLIGLIALFTHRQFHGGAGARLWLADGGADRHIVVPRFVLRGRLGGRLDAGRTRAAGGRRGGGVQRTDHRQCRRRTAGGVDRAAYWLARGLCRHR